ncbi:hypothetical protein AB0467_01305 [Streptomyces sp. NPDC052095]|uniref:hypothetical protein n=1 Tax=unclassified Streptomyces TaxID=2593676 RepID=UPI00344E58C6
MNKRQRISMISSAAVVAVLMGAGAPLASAEARHTTSASGAEALARAVLAEGDGAVVEYYPDIELGTESEARAEGGRVAAGKLGALKALLKKSPALFKAAVKAAKKGHTAFSAWVNSLSNFNPVKWAIKASPDYIVTELIAWLIHQL